MFTDWRPRTDLVLKNSFPQGVSLTPFERQKLARQTKARIQACPTSDYSGFVAQGSGLRFFTDWRPLAARVLVEARDEYDDSDANDIVECRPDVP